jgi:ADP-ribosylglycohydrolase
VTSPDTVPFTLWCADRHLDNFEEAMWTTVAGLGDRDTTCAIVGGIVALAAGPSSIPLDWLAAREPLLRVI